MDLIKQAEQGFQTIESTPAIRAAALKHVEQWLTDPAFEPYRPQLKWLIRQEEWSGLMDRFYQILPSGTGGRRGPVGIGPNRMNRWTLGASVQGHCEYLKERFPNQPRIDVVLAYDVRRFEDVRRQYNPELPNPVLRSSSKRLAQHAATVYVANGVDVHVLPPDSDRFIATPDFSFTIRHLHAQGGLNVSASHNPPDDNGGKFFDERGAQPVSPDDQIMADLVDQVTTIKQLSWDEAVRTGRVHFLDEEPHDAYLELCGKQSLVPPPVTDDFKVVFTPLQGVGGMTALPVLQNQHFRVLTVQEQMAPDGLFPNVTKSPNPEVPESMDRAMELAQKENADIVLATDPDADRLGGMIPDRAGGWRIISGNEIAALLTHFKLSKLKQQNRLPRSPIVITTQVTTGQITRIARSFNAQIVNNLLVGFKFIANVLWHLEQTGEYEDVRGTPEDFVIATEESNGAMLMPQLRDKDGASAALVLAELALDQKRRGQTTLDYLDALNEQFGYFRNKGVSVYLRGMEGRSQMMAMLDKLREHRPQRIAGLAVTEFEDLLDESGRMGPIKGATEASSRNVLVFGCGDQARLIVRPSGTEPKAKIYVEACSPPREAGTPDEEWARICKDVDALFERLSAEFVKQALALIGLDPSAVA